MRQYLMVSHSPRSTPIPRQAGFTLVELMIALTIGLILLAGVTGLIVEQSRTRTELDKTTRQIENGRYAMQMLQDDVQLAGFYGEYYTQVPAPSPAPTDLPDPCSTSLADLGDGFRLWIQGYDSPSSSPLTSCIAAANHKTGTDVLVVRRADTGATVAVASAVTGQVYLQTTVNGYRLGTTAATTPSGGFVLKKKDDTTLADLRRFHVHVYYVSPCNTPKSGTTCSSDNTDDGGQSVPTLKRLELDVGSGATVLNAVPLVEGIENIQFDYGLDSTGDGAPDSYVKNPSLAQWQDVVAIRVNLLARNNESTVGYTDTKVYPLGLENFTSGPCSANPHPNATACSNFKRHVYTAVVRVVNPSGRREAP